MHFFLGVQAAGRKARRKQGQKHEQAGEKQRETDGWKKPPWCLWPQQEPEPKSEQRSPTAPIFEYLVLGWRQHRREHQL